jgi:peroxiredoxin
MMLIDRNQAVKAQDFTLTDTTGKEISLSSYQAKTNIVLVLMRGFV